MPKLDLVSIPQTNATGCPAPVNAAVEGRWYRRLAPASGLNAMGVSHVTLKPGAWSSQRHWHAVEDEFVVVLAGEAVLVDDGDEQVMRAGDCASFPAGDRNGHICRIAATPIACSSRSAPGIRPAMAASPDIDLTFGPEGYRRKDGTPHATERLP